MIIHQLTQFIKDFVFCIAVDMASIGIPWAYVITQLTMSIAPKVKHAPFNPRYKTSPSTQFFTRDVGIMAVNSCFPVPVMRCWFILVSVSIVIIIGNNRGRWTFAFLNVNICIVCPMNDLSSSVWKSTIQTVSMNINIVITIVIMVTFKRTLPSHWSSFVFVNPFGPILCFAKPYEFWMENVWLSNT